MAAEWRRFGYRRIHVMLERQGICMNQKKFLRLYWSDLMRCFGWTGADENADIRFLKATLGWLGGPNGDAPDPNGHGVTRVIID